MIIAIIPIYWCSNILINSNSLLKVIEWQDSANLITVRVRGKQWYWVYKLSSLSNTNVHDLNILLGKNSTICLNSLVSNTQTSNLFDFWFKWNNTFFLKNTIITENGVVKPKGTVTSTQPLGTNKTSFLSSILSNLKSKECFDNFIGDHIITPNADILYIPKKKLFNDGKPLLISSTSCNLKSKKCLKNIISKPESFILKTDQKVELIVAKDILTSDILFEVSSSHRFDSLLLEHLKKRTTLIIDRYPSCILNSNLDYVDLTKKEHQGDFKFSFYKAMMNLKRKGIRDNSKRRMLDLLNQLPLYNYSIYTSNKTTGYTREFTYKYNYDIVNNDPNLFNFTTSTVNGVLDSKSIDVISKPIRLIRSFNSDTLVNIVFQDTTSLFKKPRYFLTLRQKPIKNWFSYINNSVYAGHNSAIYKSINKSVGSYIHSHQNNYSLSNSNRLLNTTTLLVLPTNKTISIISNSFDVVHSWFIPGLGIKIDCVPGRSTHHIIKIDVPGFYYGQCAEICGRFHHHMPIKVCALVFEHFLLWWQHYFIYLNVADNWADSLLFNRTKYSKFFQ